jgi:hypothetical protein
VKRSPAAILEGELGERPFSFGWNVTQSTLKTRGHGEETKAAKSVYGRTATQQSRARAGDVFGLLVDGNRLRLFRNGAEILTSASAMFAPLEHIDVSLLTPCITFCGGGRRSSSCPPIEVLGYLNEEEDRQIPMYFLNDRTKERGACAPSSTFSSSAKLYMGGWRQGRFHGAGMLETHPLEEGGVYQPTVTRGSFLDGVKIGRHVVTTSPDGPRNTPPPSSVVKKLDKLDEGDGFGANVYSQAKKCLGYLWEPPTYEVVYNEDGMIQRETLQVHSELSTMDDGLEECGGSGGGGGGGGRGGTVDLTFTLQSGELGLRLKENDCSVDRIKKNKMADRLGIQVGDVFVSISGKLIIQSADSAERYEQVTGLLQNEPRPLQVVLRRRKHSVTNGVGERTAASFLMREDADFLVPPPCRKCQSPYTDDDFDGDGYQCNGWVCDICGTHGPHGSCRWLCRGCMSDVCYDCAAQCFGDEYGSSGRDGVGRSPTLAMPPPPLRRTSSRSLEDDDEAARMSSILESSNASSSFFSSFSLPSSSFPLPALGLVGGSFDCNHDQLFVLDPMHILEGEGSEMRLMTKETTTSVRMSDDLLNVEMVEERASKVLMYGNKGFTRGVHYWEVEIVGVSWGSMTIGVSEARRSRITDAPISPCPSNRSDENTATTTNSGRSSTFSSDRVPLSGSKREFGDYGFISWKCLVDKSGQQMYGEFFHDGNETVKRTIGVLLDMDRGIIAYTNDGKSGKTGSWGKHITDSMGIAHRFVKSGGRPSSGEHQQYDGDGRSSVVAGRCRQTLWPTFIFTKCAHRDQYGVQRPNDQITLKNM